MSISLQPGDFFELAVALGAGLLIGVERERHKGTGPHRAAAGIRTFALVALVGALAEKIGGAGLLVAGAAVCLLIVASYWRSRSEDPGLTTEMAMLVTFFIGVLAVRATALAGALAIVLAVLLASKARLHAFVRKAMTAEEVQDVLLLFAAAFVVLPLLPDRVIDPWQSINPHRLWMLLVAVMTVNTFGYVALRAFGARLGLSLAGLAGGFVSSTATIAAMSGHARDAPENADSFASAALLSNLATVIQLAVVIGALAPSLLREAALPLVASGFVALAAAVLASRRAFSVRSPESRQVLAKRPFEIRHVAGFVLVLAVISLAAGVTRHYLGEGALVWTIGLSGLLDVHAAAASAAQMLTAGQLPIGTALIAVLAALSANSIVKCLFAARGGRGFAVRVVPGVVLMSAAFALVLLVQANPGR